MQFAPPAKPDRQPLDHRGRVPKAEDLLARIQDKAVRRTMRTHGQPVYLGRYRIDDRVYGHEGQRAELTWAPVEKHELIRSYELLLPDMSRWQLQDMRRAGIDFDRLFIVDEMAERGHKQYVERIQYIPRELVEPISRQEHVRQEIKLKWRALVSWSRPHMARLAESIKWSMPKLVVGLGVLAAGVAAITVLVAIMYVIVTVLAAIAIVAIVLLGLAAGAGGLDPILFGAVDHDDGTSSLYYLTHYSYPVRKT